MLGRFTVLVLITAASACNGNGTEPYPRLVSIGCDTTYVSSCPQGQPCPTVSDGGVACEGAPRTGNAAAVLGDAGIPADTNFARGCTIKIDYGPSGEGYPQLQRCDCLPGSIMQEVGETGWVCPQ